MSAKVNGLGHIGFYVQDLELMKEFYGKFMGMTLTKVGPLGAFFSADPEGVDHEIALISGRTSLEDPHWIQQMSMRVDSLDDLRDFKRRINERGYKIDRIVTHASAIGCYFRDPENNPTEVFWLTGHTSWAQIAIPIDVTIFEGEGEGLLRDLSSDIGTQTLEAMGAFIHNHIG